jgi:uncharacterized membrane protein
VRIRALVTPGTSALFVLSGVAGADRLVAALADREAQVVRWTITQEDERRLLATFGEESG